MQVAFFEADEQYKTYKENRTKANFDAMVNKILQGCRGSNLFAKKGKSQPGINIDPVTKKNIYKNIIETVIWDWISDNKATDYYLAKNDPMDTDEILEEIAEEAVEYNPIYVVDEQIQDLSLSRKKITDLMREYLKTRIEWEYKHPGMFYEKLYLDQYSRFYSYLTNLGAAQHHQPNRSRQHSRRGSKEYMRTGSLPIASTNAPLFSPRKISNEIKESKESKVINSDYVIETSHIHHGSPIESAFSSDEALGLPKHSSIATSMHLLKSITSYDFPSFGNVIGWTILLKRPLLLADMLGDVSNVLAEKICLAIIKLGGFCLDPNINQYVSPVCNGLIGGTFIFLKLCTLALDTVINYDNIVALGDKCKKRMSGVHTLKLDLVKSLGIQKHEESERSTHSQIQQRISQKQNGSPSITPRIAPQASDAAANELQTAPLQGTDYSPSGGPLKPPMHSRKNRMQNINDLNVPTHISSKSWVPNTADFDLRVVIDSGEPTILAPKSL